MKRRASVLVFRKEATRQDIEAALKSISHILEPEYWIENKKKVPFRIEEYDDTDGGPVFYIP